MIYYVYGLNKLLGGENMNKLTDEHIEKMIEVLRFGICPAPVNMIAALKELQHLRMGARLLKYFVLEDEKNVK